MKKLLLGMMALATLGFISCGTDPEVNRVTQVTVSPDEHAMTIGQTKQLTVTVLPEDADDKSVTWSSNDPAIATVSATGLVTAVELGETVIKAVATDGAITGTCKINVQAEVIDVETLTLDAETHKMYTDDTFILHATLLPEKATDKAVSWKSSDPTIAKVEGRVAEDGKIEGVVTTFEKTGEVTITAVSSNNEEATDACVITVDPIVNSVLGFHIEEEAPRLIASVVDNQLTGTLQLTPVFDPSNATNQGVEWESSNVNIATVDQETGLVTAVAKGVVTITATTHERKNGVPAFTDTCELEVFIPVEGIQVWYGGSPVLSTQFLIVGGETSVRQRQLEAKVLPAGIASNQNVTWTSSEPLKVEVDQTGLITALDKGDAVITATTEDVNPETNEPYTYTVNVTARSYVTSIKMKANDVELTNNQEIIVNMTTNDEYTLSAEVAPTTAEDANIYWTAAGHTNYFSFTAQPDGTYKIVGIKPHDESNQSTQILVIPSVDGVLASDNAVRGRVMIKVIKSPTALTIEGDAEMKPGDTQKLTTIATPSDASAAVTDETGWTSSNTDVAEFDWRKTIWEWVDLNGGLPGTTPNLEWREVNNRNYGMLIAKEEGTTTISATSTIDPNITGSMTVTVKADVIMTGISMYTNWDARGLTYNATTPATVTFSASTYSIVPTGATDKRLDFAITSGTEFASVEALNNDTEGKVTALAPGIATLTISSKVNPAAKVEIPIRINKPITGLSFGADDPLLPTATRAGGGASIRLTAADVGSKFDFSPTSTGTTKLVVTPSDYTPEMYAANGGNQQYMTWVSKDPGVIALDPDDPNASKTGKFVIKGYGATLITAALPTGSYINPNPGPRNLYVIVAPPSDASSVLGTPGFITATQKTIGSQIWSDAVYVTKARGDMTYVGGTGSTTVDPFTNSSGCGGYYDFRQWSNVAEDAGTVPTMGDLFSWNIVDEYGYYLCGNPSKDPDGWRVPTKDDFVAMASMLVPSKAAANNPSSNWGTAQQSGLTNDEITMFMGTGANQFGAILTGQAAHNQAANSAISALQSYYWSASLNDARAAAYGFYTPATYNSGTDTWTNPNVNVVQTAGKSMGKMVRCVKTVVSNE